MNDTHLTAPQILTQAADILAAQGWTRQGDYDHVPYLPAEHCPVDLGAALALAAGVDMHSVEATSPELGVHADAVLLLARHVFGADAPVMAAGWALDKLTTWQDETGRTAEQVIAALRAAAEPAPVEPEKSPVQELAAAISSALILPKSEISVDARRYQVMCDRVACVIANMEHLVIGADEDMFRHVLARLAEIPADAPVTYPTRDEQAGGAR